MKITKELKKIMKPVSFLKTKYIDEFEERMNANVDKRNESISFNFLDLLVRKGVKTIVFDTGFVCFTTNRHTCYIETYFVSKDCPDEKRDHRRIIYDFWKKNGIKKLVTHTYCPEKVWSKWGFDMNRYELVKKL